MNPENVYVIHYILEASCSIIEIWYIPFKIKSGFEDRGYLEYQGNMFIKWHLSSIDAIKEAQIIAKEQEERLIKNLLKLNQNRGKEILIKDKTKIKK